MKTKGTSKVIQARGMLSIALITKSQVMWNMIFLTQRRNGSMTKQKKYDKKEMNTTTLNDDDDDICDMC